MVPDVSSVEAVKYLKLLYTEVCGDKFLASVPNLEDTRSVSLDDGVAAGDPPLAGGDGGVIDDEGWDDDVLPSSSTALPFKKTLVRRISAAIGGTGGYCGGVEEDIGIDAEMLAILDTMDGEYDQHEEESENDDADLPDLVPAPGLDAGELEVSAGNCVETLAMVTSIEAVQEYLPDFQLNMAWDVMQLSCGERISSTNCVAGESLKTTCWSHDRCQLWLKDVMGDLDSANCEVFKWAIAGTALTREEHKKTTKLVAARWSERHRF